MRIRYLLETPFVALIMVLTHVIERFWPDAADVVEEPWPYEVRYAIPSGGHSSEEDDDGTQEE